MEKFAPIFLKLAIIGLGLLVLGICIFGLPQAIGSLSLGGYDPILIGLYVPAVPFFIALFYAVQLLACIESGKAFSKASVRAFRRIKYCAASIAGIFVMGLPYIFSVADQDDAPGVVALALVIICTSTVISVFAGLMQRLVQQAVTLKRENDLTV